MTTTLDDNIRKFQERILNTPDEKLQTDESFLKRTMIQHINWRNARFNNDAEEVKNEQGEIIAYKGRSFRSEVYTQDFLGNLPDDKIIDYDNRQPTYNSHNH